MNPLSSSTFREQNNILQEFKIIPAVKNLKNRNMTIGEYRDFKADAGHLDVIDLDNNNRTNHSYKVTGLFPPVKHLETTEPVLQQPLKVLKQTAESRNIEVITQDDAPDMKVNFLTLKGYVFSGYAHPTNPKSLTELAAEIDPLGAKWAIDLKEESFILFEPKK